MLENKGHIVFFIFGAVAIAGSIFITKDECPPNEEYLLCGSPCPANCSSPEGDVTCPEDCIEGCFCKTGYLRKDNETCVTADQCSGNGGDLPICRDNEEFLSCGTACPLTCSQPEGLECGLACSNGCFCKSGYVRDTINNKCVTLDQCPLETCLNSDEVYDPCIFNCEPSCADPEPLCTQICAGGCVCAPGLLRADDGACVSVEKCPNNSSDPGLLGKYLNAINRILHLSADSL